MKINGNIVSCAGNFALRARCKVARGTSHFVLVARLRGELRTPCSLQGCAGNFALRARCKVARGTSRFALVARLRGELRSMYGTVSLRVLIEMENSRPPHYPLKIKNGFP